jgi:hypothetical protein
MLASTDGCGEVPLYVYIYGMAVIKSDTKLGVEMYWVL